MKDNLELVVMSITDAARASYNQGYEKGYADGLKDAVRTMTERQKDDFARQGELERQSGCNDA